MEGRPQYKICHLTESFLPKVGGAQVMVDSLASEQAALGHRVFVACPRYPGLTGPEPATGYVVARCFGSTIVSFAFGVIPWFRLARRERFDIIHAHNAWPAGLLAAAAAKLFGAALVITSHGRDIVTDPSIGYGSRLNPVVDRLIRKALRAADRHTIVRESMRASAVVAGSALERIVAIPNFVREMPVLRGECRDGETYLLALGRLHPVKGFDVAIRAFSRVHEALPDVKLIIAGSGGEFDNLKRLAGELGLSGVVEVVGQVTGEAKSILIANALALLVTSRLEAFPVAPLEVMAGGTPVLAPDTEPFNELINAGNGLHIDPDRPDTLLQAVNFLLAPSNRARLSRGARETAAQFTAAAVIPLYEKVYADVLEEKRRSPQTAEVR